MLSTEALIFFIVIFVSSSRGIVFNCDFGLQGFLSLGYLYTCSVYREDVSGNNTALVDVRGSHVSGKRNENVESIILYYQNSYNRIPTNIDNFFPNLTAIQFVYGSLTSVTAEDLQPFPNLRMFSAPYSKLVYLDGDMFKHTPKIQILEFYVNPITNVGYDLLTGLTDLVLVDLRSVSCINSYANSRAAIRSLNNELLRQCPPLATTTAEASTTLTSTTSGPSECSIRCTIDEEIDRLRSQVDALIEANEMYEKKFIKMEERLVALEYCGSCN